MSAACGGTPATTTAPAGDEPRETAPAGNTKAADSERLRVGTCFVIDLVRYGPGGSQDYYSYPPQPARDYDPMGGGGAMGIDSLGPGAAQCHWGFDGDALAGALPELQRCYDAAVAAGGPPPAGRIVVESLADGDGAVSSARVLPDLGEELATCVNDAATANRIPRNADEENLYEAYRESAEYAEREMGEVIEVPEPPVRPIVCAVHAPIVEPSPSVTLELTPTSVAIDGEEVVDIALLQDGDEDLDRALSWISARVPAEYLVPEAFWSLGVRAHPAVDTRLVDLLLSYLQPTTVHFARAVGTSDGWQYVNPRGTPGLGFCTVRPDELTIRIAVDATGRVDLSAEGETAGNVGPLDSGGADLPGLRGLLDDLKRTYGGRTDAIVIARDDVVYRDLVNVVEVAVSAGFVDTAVEADAYQQLQQRRDAMMVDP